jgi:alpha-beta hydrolase superfamily lysophospholipase
MLPLLAGFEGSSAAAAVAVARQDFQVRTEDGLRIFVREVRSRSDVQRGEPLILVHGARVPGLGSFDLEVPGGSLAADLAQKTGRAVYVMDARGYGKSDRPTAMDQPPNSNPSQARAFQVVRDIAAVVAEARRRSGSHTVALMGWMGRPSRTTPYTQPLSGS